MSALTDDQVRAWSERSACVAFDVRGQPCWRPAMAVSVFLPPDVRPLADDLGGDGSWLPLCRRHAKDLVEWRDAVDMRAHWLHLEQQEAGPPSKRRGLRGVLPPTR